MPDGCALPARVVDIYPPIEFTVPGEAVGKGRARSAMRRDGLGLTHYTPAKTRNWESLVRNMAFDAMLRAGRRDERGMPRPYLVPIHLTISIVHAVPDSWPAWKRTLALAWEIEPTVKPDEDNVEKCIKDALSGVVWRDDAQVTACVKGKRYGTEALVNVQAVPRMTYPAQISRRP